MKKIISVAVVMHIFLWSGAQVIKECGTPSPRIKPVVTSEKLQRAANQKVLYSSPYPLKVFIRVFANNDGSNLAATEADVLRQFENMRGFYHAHNICFILSGYEITRNSDLNDMNKDEANDLFQLQGMVINNSLNIFIHNVLVDNDGGLNGSAYAIPNHYLSLVSTAVSSTTNLSTMAHEMGHCLGLLHTFEDAYGLENVARSGSCKDCDVDGDLLCDTQADLNNDNANVNTSCIYTGNAMDACGALYLCEETNIMTYGRRSCRDQLSVDQGGRATIFLLTDHDNRIAENTLSIANASVTTGLANYSARNSITFLAGNYTVSGTASANFSSRAIIFSPGVELKPQVGYVHARVGTYCQ